MLAGRPVVGPEAAQCSGRHALEDAGVEVVQLGVACRACRYCDFGDSLPLSIAIETPTDLRGGEGEREQNGSAGMSVALPRKYIGIHCPTSATRVRSSVMFTPAVCQDCPT